MYQNERHAIESLFSKLSSVEQQAGPRDADADQFIREKVSEQPGAPYYMAQTIVVQEQALTAAQDRIEELERRVAGAESQRSGGFLSSLFGSSSARPQAGGQAQNGRPSPWGQPSSASHGSAGRPGFGGQGFGAQGMAGQGMGAMGGRGGGGFLAGAAQTAMGVAGGVLLGNAIGGMFADTPAAPTETAAAEPAAAEPAAADEQMDLGGFDEFEI